MLRHILFDVSFFEDERDRENSQKRVLWLLEALTRCNQLYLRQHPKTPLIYQSGIKYTVPEQFERANVPEVDAVRKYLNKKGASEDVKRALETIANMCGSGEHFREIPRIIENGGTDCDGLCAWRTAELRELGIPAKPYITWRKRPDGGTTYHCIVRWEDGSSEDPSLLLGMNAENRKADRIEEERKLGERMGDFLAGMMHSKKSVLGGIVTPQDFSQLQYSIPFQTDDSYEDWSPTRPQAFYAHPQYQGGLISQSGPIFNTRLRDPDDWDDRFDGDVPPSKVRSWERQLRRTLRAA